jgi:hypothetical protein
MPPAEPVEHPQIEGFQAIHPASLSSRLAPHGNAGTV